MNYLGRDEEDIREGLLMLLFVSRGHERHSQAFRLMGSGENKFMFLSDQGEKDSHLCKLGRDTQATWELPSTTTFLYLYRSKASPSPFSPFLRLLISDTDHWVSLGVEEHRNQLSHPSLLYSRKAVSR